MMNFLSVLKLNFVESIITTFVNNALSEVKVLAVAVLAWFILKGWKEQKWVKVLSSVAFSLVLWYVIDGRESSLSWLLEQAKNFLGLK